MIRTSICDLLEIDHPIALGGMGSASSPAMTAAVSRAGGLGAMGCHYLSPEQIRERTAATRKETNKPFGLNFLLFDTREDSFAAALELRPAVMQFAWARTDQELSPYFDRAHEARCEGRGRYHHSPGQRGWRARWLDGQHAPDPDGGRCSRTSPGISRGRVR
jgi:hypothetical protein